MSNDRFRADPVEEGRIEVEVGNSVAAAKITVDHEHAAIMVAALLSAAKESQAMTGVPLSPPTKLAGTLTFIPSGLGLSSDSPVAGQQTCLVIHAGHARIGIAIANARELGLALLASSAAGDPKQ